MTWGERRVAIDATWAPGALRLLSPFTLREGLRGGRRVSSASCPGSASEAQIDAAISAMVEPLFAVSEDQPDLDAQLEARGLDAHDHTLWLECDADALSEAPPPVTGFAVWPPLQVQRDIWAAGGIDAARIAVMERVKPPKAAILGRHADRPAGTAFVALHDDLAIVHAMEVLEEHRRSGLGRHMMHHAARWAMGHGARRVAVLVTQANTSAYAFYESLGMTGGVCYHYRSRPGGQR